MLTINKNFKPIPKQEPKPKPGRPRKVKEKSDCPPNAVEEVHELLDLPINSEGTTHGISTQCNNNVHKQKKSMWSEGMPASKWSRRLLTGKI
jgi:hypothetical protein